MDENNYLWWVPQTGELESCRNGELESWRAGELEGWRAGELEGWRAGELESVMSSVSPLATAQLVSLRCPKLYSRLLASASGCEIVDSGGSKRPLLPQNPPEKMGGFAPLFCQWALR